MTVIPSPLRLLRRQAESPSTPPREAPPLLLFPAVAAPENLRAAWHRVAGNPGAQTPGVDGETCEQITRPSEWLERLADHLIHDCYQPRRIRWIEIAKPSGDTRRLGILTLTDRVVHTAVKQVLEPRLDPFFAEMSFGYRPGRSPAHALAQVLDRLEGPTAAPRYPWAAALDVQDCFDSIDHHLLHAALEQQLADPAMLKLLARLMVPSAQYRRHWWRRRRVGLVQGSPLSPLLCNLYLHPLDRALEDLAEETGEGVVACRYADDLLLLARRRRELVGALHTARRVLGSLRMRFGARRADLRPTHLGFSWLGVDIHPRAASHRGARRFGYLIPAAKIDHLLQRVDQQTEPREPDDDRPAPPLNQRFTELNAMLRSWAQAYRPADNAQVVFGDIDRHLFLRVQRLLRAETGLNRALLREAHLTRTPEGFRTWRAEEEQLLVLATLPERPLRKLRRIRRS